MENADLPELTQLALKRNYHSETSWMSWFCLAEVFWQVETFWRRAMLEGIAKTYIIVGGQGHARRRLFGKWSQGISENGTQTLSEAEILNTYLKERYNLTADYLESHSTNCGEQHHLFVGFAEKRKD